MDGIDTGTRGSYYFDSFSSNRSTNWAVGDSVSKTISYTYDPLYRLTAADGSDSTFFHYTYDAVGNRTSETVQGMPASSYNYDIANRLTGVDGVTYTWDNNGNLLSDGVNTLIYNTANRLTSLTRGSHSYQYAYNGMGDRLRQIADGVTTNYALDIAGGLSQMLTDGTNTYTYGLTRIAQYSGGAATYFLGDGLDSVRQLTTASGSLAMSRNYEPYGSMFAPMGSGSTSYGFAGEWTDPSRLVNLRTRYYAPWQGRFISQDIWLGDTKSPMSYNLWLYVNANPIKYIDPLGKRICHSNSFCNSLQTPETDPRDIVPFYDYAKDEFPTALEGYAGQEKISPSGIAFTPPEDPLWRGAIGIPQNHNAAQFVKRFHDPDDKDYWFDSFVHMEKGEENTYFNLCGQISVAAILEALVSWRGVQISVDRVLRDWEQNMEMSLKNTTSSYDLSSFINNYYSNMAIGQSDLSSPYIWNKVPENQFPQQLARWLSNSYYLMAGVEIVSGSSWVEYGGFVGKTTRPSDQRISHWVVITGMSLLWDKENLESGKNWIRIYNSFDNATEYYWGKQFINAFYRGGGFYTLISAK